MTRRLTAALLGAAARRWPEARRAELRREWDAEVHVLAEEGRWWAMLRYATSLAAARPAREPVDAVTRLRQAWRALRLVVLGPLATVVLTIAALYGASLAGIYLPPGVMQYQGLVADGLCLLAALALALLGARWGLPDRPATLAAAVTVPALAMCLLLMDVGGSAAKVRTHALGYLLFGGLALVLAWAGRRGRTGRRRSARWIAAGAALVLADLAVIVVMRPHTGSQLQWAYAPLWLLTALTGQSAGVPEWPDAFTVADIVGLDPIEFLVFTGFAFGVTLGRRSLPSEGVGRVV